MPIDPAIFQFGQRNLGRGGPPDDQEHGMPEHHGSIEQAHTPTIEDPAETEIPETAEEARRRAQREAVERMSGRTITQTGGEGFVHPNPMANDPTGQAMMDAAGYEWDADLGEWVEKPLTDIEQAQEDSAMRDMGYVWNEETGEWDYEPEEEGIPDLSEEALEDFETIEESAITALEEGVQESVGDFWEKEMARLAARGIMGPGTEESSITQRTIADVAEGSAEAIASGTTAIQANVAASKLDYRMGAAGIDVAREQAQSTAQQGWANIMQQGQLGQMQTMGNVWNMQQATQQAEADRAQQWAIAEASNASAQTIANINANAQTSAAEEANQFNWTDLIPTFGFSF